MTVDNENNTNGYTGDNSTTVFAYTFRILDDDDIAVTIDGTLQTKTTDYSVAGVGKQGGGSITFLTAPATSTAIVLKRGGDLTQAVDFTENDALPAETLEQTLDRLTMLLQQLKFEIDALDTRITVLEP